MKILRLGAAIILITLLSGCFMQAGVDLYALPQQNPEHAGLLRLIGGFTVDGWAASAPLTGENRTAMQFAEITAGGRQAVVFMKNAKSLLLRIVVFTQNPDGGYSHWLTIEDSGDQFDRVEYADLDGDGRREIIAGWRHESASAYSLRVHRLGDGGAEMLTDERYTGFSLSDMTMDGFDDLVILSHDESGQKASATLFSYSKQGGEVVGTVRLSAGVRVPESILTGMLGPDMPAVTVEGRLEDNSLISDVLCCLSGRFVNLSFFETTNRSESTLRKYEVYCDDVDSNGYIEVPVVRNMPASEIMTSYRPGVYCSWYSYGYDGRLVVPARCVTYINQRDRWYFILPDNWAEYVFVYDAETEVGSGKTFAVDYKNSVVELMTIYTYDSAIMSLGIYPPGQTFLGENMGLTFTASVTATGASTPYAIGGIDDILSRIVAVNAYGETLFFS